MVVATPPRSAGWMALFTAAFSQSRNAMTLVDDQRRHVEVNGAFLSLLGYRRDELIGHPVREIVAGGPLVSPREWERLLHEKRFSGEAGLIAADGTVAGVQYGATPEIITGRQLVLFVAVSTSRWGRHFRREVDEAVASGTLSERELQIVQLVAMGRSGPEIADELHISHGTVRTHVRNAMTKVGARSRAHLVAKALGEGQIWATRSP